MEWQAFYHRSQCTVGPLAANCVPIANAVSGHGAQNFGGKSNIRFMGLLAPTVAMDVSILSLRVLSAGPARGGA